MIRRAFDENGDYAINSFISESEATIQAVATRLRLFLGEYFLDLNQGVPYYQQILTKPARLDEIEKIFRTTILQTEGVKELLKFELIFNRDIRKLSVLFTANTIYGDEIEDVIGLNPLGA